MRLTFLQASSELAHNLKQIASSLSAAPSSQAQTSEQVGFFHMVYMLGSAGKLKERCLHTLLQQKTVCSCPWTHCELGCCASMQPMLYEYLAFMLITRQIISGVAMT